MTPRITVVTLGVDDLTRSFQFYRDGLGFPVHDISGTVFEQRSVAFFDLQAGLRLALWHRESIAQDAGIPAGSASPTECILGYSVSSTAEVDELLANAGAAGARIVKKARKTFWGGYAGYFQDPDQHLWTVMCSLEPEGEE